MVNALIKELGSRAKCFMLQEFKSSPTSAGFLGPILVTKQLLERRGGGSSSLLLAEASCRGMHDIINRFK